MKKLETFRKKIDSYDQQILKLLSLRGKAAQEIGHIKKQSGSSILAPAREKAVYERLSRLNAGPFKNEAILSVFREIISATRALEQPLNVSYLGPEATFTQMAAVQQFGSSAHFVPESGIQNIFSSVEKGHSDFGVVPVENTTEGVVSHTLDLFVDSPLKICSEIILRVRQHLLSKENSLAKIKVVYSHPQALAQCRYWLSAHLPTASLCPVDSTSLAAKKAAGEKGSAAIASELASSCYRLPILEKEVQDQTQNYTRFLVIGYNQPDITGKDKTSILFVTHDEPGILYKTLAPLAKEKINLTKIESRPLKKRIWEYMFFVDLDGHINNPKVSRVLNGLKKQCSFFKILGSYPKA